MPDDITVVIPKDADLDVNGDSPQDTPIDFSEFEDALRGPTVHFFPYGHEFRKSGAVDPQVGDLALCGEVKTGVSTWGKKFIGAPISCAKCDRRRH